VGGASGTKKGPKYIISVEDLDAFTKFIRWFSSEPSVYTGAGNYRIRKAPSAHAK